MDILLREGPQKHKGCFTGSPHLPEAYRVVQRYVGGRKAGDGYTLLNKVSASV